MTSSRREGAATSVAALNVRGAAGGDGAELAASPLVRGRRNATMARPSGPPASDGAAGVPRVGEITCGAAKAPSGPALQASMRAAVSDRAATTNDPSPSTAAAGSTSVPAGPGTDGSCEVGPKPPPILLLTDARMTWTGPVSAEKATTPRPPRRLSATGTRGPSGTVATTAGPRSWLLANPPRTVPTAMR